MERIESTNHILLERKCVKEDTSVGGNIENSLSHKVYNIIVYACFISDTFSLQEDIFKFSSKRMFEHLKDCVLAITFYLPTQSYTTFINAHACKIHIDFI